MAVKVVLAGITGKMGKVILEMLLKNNFEVVAGLALSIKEYQGIPVYSQLSDIKDDYEFLIDFTRADFAESLIKEALRGGKKVLSGTTGFSEETLKDFSQLVAENKSASLLIAPNFSIGAVLMMEFSKLAASFFEKVEIIEYHHTQKLDAPSGTSKLTRRKIQENRKEWTDIPIHSVRLPGMVAHQEVIYSNQGEVFTIRHDSLDRISFMKGILKGINYLLTHSNVYLYGLEKILDLPV